MSDMPRGLKIVITVVGTLLGLWMLLAGSSKFLSRDLFDTMFTDLGLPLWLVPVTGVLEILGGVLVIVPRTAKWGAVLVGAVMVGAAASHLVSGFGSPAGALLALTLAGTVATVRWRYGGLAKS